MGQREMKHGIRLKLAGLMAALSLALPIQSPSAQAQEWPSKPIRVVYPYSAGGVGDTSFRALMVPMEPRLGQRFVVENRVGAAATLGAAFVANAKPDGTTFLFGASPQILVAPFLQKVNYDSSKSFDFVGIFGTGPNILALHRDVPAKTVPELIAYGKANPGKISYASGGHGSHGHLTGGLFASRAGIDIVHVPYRGGGPSIQDVVAGNIQMTFEGTGVLLPLVRAGKLRMLATVSPKRLPEMPDVPTMEEAGYPGFVSQSWTGLLAPANTSPDIVNRLNAQINDALRDKAFVESLAKLGADPLGGSPQEFAALIKADIGRWQPLVKALNLKTE